MRNISCQETGMIYDLKGDYRTPIGTVSLENIQVQTILDKPKNIENVRNVIEKNIIVGSEQ